MPKAKFYLTEHWWRGAVVIRGERVSHWDLRYDEGKIPFRYWSLDKNPVYIKERINALEKECKEKRWLTFEGAIPPRPKAPDWLKPGNPNKSIPAHVDRLDEGSVTILSDTDKFKSFIFKGKKLKGYWIMRKTLPKELVWIFEKSSLPGGPLRKKESVMLNENELDDIFVNREIYSVERKIDGIKVFLEKKGEKIVSLPEGFAVPETKSLFNTNFLIEGTLKDDFYVSDILRLGRRNLAAKSWQERKQALSSLNFNPKVRMTYSFIAKSPQTLRKIIHVLKLISKGCILKNLADSYEKEWMEISWRE
uniref:DNA ligase domain protein n=1 Tax=viral metagenome TaxID=1070528 RepID=A0A6H1ZRP4_9ZZZZ